MTQGMTLNQKVAAWASGHRGKKVGAGECWDLGEQALQRSGAKTSYDFGEVGPDSDYVWGDPVAVKDVIPGDIIQFRDHVITTVTTTVYTFADGTTETLTQTQEETRPHHTAVVIGAPQPDGSLKTLEQQKGEVVHAKSIHTRDVTARKTGHERRKYPNTKRVENVETTKNIEVTVTGTIWFYRPKAK